MTSRHAGSRRTKNARGSNSSQKPEMSMSAFLVTISTDLTANQLAGARRRQAALLAEHGVVLRTVRRQKSIVPAILRAVYGQPGAPVAVIDEKTTNPAEAGWLRELRNRTEDQDSVSPPQIIFVTRRASAQGTAQSKVHPLVRGYVQRDNKGRWVDTVADRIIDLLKAVGQASTVAGVPFWEEIPGIVGTSRCFREAVGRLADIFDAPCGMVTGEVGAGKMYLIRSMYPHRISTGRMIVLPCGVFFKDYYIGGSHRVLGGGREAVDQLAPYLDEADRGMLILHHVERLPTAVQDEFATVLQESAANREAPERLTRVDSEGLQERDVRVIATSTMPPESLAQTGRLLPELARRLAKHHVRIPPLRERGPEDVRLLTYEILPRVSTSVRRATPEIDEDAMSALERVSWSNNISDLVRALEHAVRVCKRGRITPKDFPKWLGSYREAKGRVTLDEIVKEAQRSAILNALDYAGGDVNEAARMLGRNPKGFYRLMKDLGLKTKRLRTDFIRR